MSRQPVELLEQVGDIVRNARQGVLQVGAHSLRQSEEELLHAAGLLREVVLDIRRKPAANTGCLRPAEDVGEQIRNLGALLSQAAAFYQGWLETVAARAGGYRVDGQPVRLPDPVRAIARV